MSKPLAEPTDVEAALLRPLTPTEDQYVPTLIAQASARLRTKRRLTDARIAAWELDPADPVGLDPTSVAALIATVVKRYLLNPGGAISTAWTEGPFGGTTMFAAARASGAGGHNGFGEIAITDEDLAQLDPASSFAMPKTIHTGSSVDPIRRRW